MANNKFKLPNILSNYFKKYFAIDIIVQNIIEKVQHNKFVIDRILNAKYVIEKFLNKNIMNNPLLNC